MYNNLKIHLFCDDMKPNYLKIYFLAICCLPLFSYAQDKEYARQVIEKLTAIDMHGRGYVEDGDAIAGHYVQTQMETLGALAFDYNFYQDFIMTVNTFPSNMKVTVEGQELVPGVDFLVKPSSGGASGNFKLKWVNLESIKKKEIELESSPAETRKTLMVVDGSEAETKEDKELLQSLWSNPLQLGGVVILTDEKLTWGVSQKQDPWVQLEIKHDKLPKGTTNISLKIDAKYNPKHRSQNIVGFLEGKDEPDSFIVFTGHYDHLGHMGKNTYFPGANDNASGISMLLDMIQHYAKYENQCKYSIAFIAFGAEEAGLVGSQHYVADPVFPLEKIKFLINLDLLGTGEEGITVVNATKHEKEYNTLVKLNEKNKYLAQVKKRGPAANSDHYFFSQKGVPAFFIYTMGGIAAYHDIHDKAETLPLTEYHDVFKLITGFVKELEK